MTKNKKVIIVVVAIVGLLLISVGTILLITNRNKKDDSYEKYLEENKKNNPTPDDKDIVMEGHIDGNVDTIEEFQYLLENVDPSQGFTYQFVSETDTTITFQKVDDATKQVIGTSVMDKNTFEVISTGLEEDSK